MSVFSITSLQEISVKQAMGSVPDFKGDPAAFDMWDEALLYCAYTLKVDGFVRGLQVYRLEGPDSESAAMTATASAIFETSTNIEVVIVSKKDYKAIEDNLACLYGVLRKSIFGTPSIFSIANQDKAMERHDVIAAYKNIRAHFVLTTGLGLLGILGDFFRLPTAGLNTSDLIAKMELCRRQLSERRYILDDTISVAMLIACVQNPQLQFEMNSRVTEALSSNGSYPFEKACQLVRDYEKHMSRVPSPSGLQPLSTSRPLPRPTSPLSYPHSRPAKNRRCLLQYLQRD